MSFGFLAVNGNNQVLVSSDTRNFHLIAKFSSPDSVSKSSSAYGGFQELTYNVQCTVTPVPFFTMPTNDYYGIAGIKNTTGNTWEIRLIRSGNSTTYPEVYVFADPRGWDAYGETFGMQVYRDDGTKAFDSRRSPLAITGGTAVVHTANPRTSIPGLSARYCESGNGHGGLTPDTESAAYAISNMPAKPMFHYSSLAQAEREAGFYDSDEDCLGVDAYGVCWGYGTSNEYLSTYWAFYRGGIRRSNSNVYAGWIAVAGGCYWSTWEDSDFVGIGLGGDDYSGGSGPFSNETINLASTAVIIGNAARYD